MADSRYNRLDNQAPAQAQLKANAPDVGRSAHDFSFNHVGNCLIGALTPFDCFDVVPNEDIDLSLIAYFEFRNPTTRQLFNGFRVFFHYYYNRLTDLWEGAQNWLDKGRSGKLELTRPNLIFTESFTDANSKTRTVNACSPLSLLNYLGIPCESVQTHYKDSGSEYSKPLRWFQSTVNIQDSSDVVATKVNNHIDYFPADCCMAYQRNWRDYYSNKNLLQNNKFWFPDNEHHFILSYSCENAVAIFYENEDLKLYEGEPWASENSYHASVFQNINGVSTDILNNKTPEPNNPMTNADPATALEDLVAPNLSGLKFRQFRGDRFSTALPFPDLIRGDIPSIFSNQKDLELLYKDNTENPGYHHVGLKRESSDVGTYNASLYSFSSLYESESPASHLVVQLPSSSITMSDIYTLETLTAFKKKMGMTNGDYNEMIKAQYGVDPNIHDGKGTYIGGFYQDFQLNAVLQQSESNTTPLGTRAGTGQSSGTGSIGHFHTPDFGWIQGYFSIVPDVFYTQGKPRMFSKKSNLEMYFPIFNNLPAQNIRNDELFVSNNSPTTDIAPFAYEDRYAEYKSRPNRVSGLMALPHSIAEYDSSRVMARRFTSLPALNHNFITMVPENIDMSVFTVAGEPPFDFAIGVNCRRVFPGPYTAIEGSLSSPRLNA